MNNSPSRPEQIILQAPPPLWVAGLHTLGANVLAIALGLLSNVALARLLGPSGKGVYDLALAAAALAGIVLGLSLPSGVIYVAAREKLNLRILATQLAAVVLVQGLLAAFFLSVIQPASWAVALLPPELGRAAIVLIALTLIFTEYANYWRALLLGRQEIMIANRRDLAARAIHLALLLAAITAAFFAALTVTAALLLWLNLAVMFLRSAIFLQALRKPWRASHGSSGFKQMLQYALPCYFSNLTQFLNYRLDVFLVSFFVGSAAVGWYVLAASMAQLLWQFSNAAATVLMPRIAASSHEREQHAERTAQVTRLVFWLSLCLGLVLLSMVRPLVILLYGEAFRPSLAPIFWLMPGVVVFSIANVLASYLAGIGRPQLNLLVSLAGLVVTLALDLLLIPRWNIVGAAIASSASYFTSAVVIIVLFRRESGARLRDLLLPQREDFARLRALAAKLFQTAHSGQ